MSEAMLTYIPQKLLNHVETVYGENKSFIDSYKEWLAIKKKAGDAVSVDVATRDFKKLLSCDNPVESIEESIRYGSKRIFIFSNKQSTQQTNNFDNREQQESPSITIRKVD